MDDQKCLNHRFENYCRFCVDICPHDAVTYSGRIKVDETRCSGCGICAAGCPTRCLKIPEPDWETVLDKAIKKKTPCLGCQKSLNPSTTITVPCLGGLPEELIAAIYLLSGSGFGLDLTGCFECVQKTALRQLQHSLFRAKKITGGKLNFKVKMPDRNTGKNNNLLDHENLALLGRNVTEISASLFGTMVPRELFNEKSAKKPPLPRELLLKVLPPNRNGSIYLTSYKVDQTCHGCGFCQAVCPQKAWELVFKDNCAALSHYPLRCTGCGLCAAICQKGAKRKIVIAWSAGADKPLGTRNFQASSCKECNKSMLDDENRTSLCPSCTNRRALQESIKQWKTGNRVLTSAVFEAELPKKSE